ncbi:MAG: NAD(P)/FAD-dependent oxidoreductase [Hyphomicrobiales bacterium]|nr:MAG: NAD(P)/FAD-dependent oxidoreductase [Hyphomicrobiales bacterium]
MHDGLSLLESRVAADLARTAHPRAAWLKPVMAPDGTPAHDVIIIGGGQSGLATAFGLLRSRVDNILLLDKAPSGQEGPWRSYARMHTLRSPKDFTGPDLDMPSLTYQSWHEAKFGTESWDELTLIPKGLWADYLAWFRHVVGIPVRNEAEVVDIAPAEGLLAVTVRSGSAETVLHARKLVLATGQESMGDWSLPAPVAALPAGRRAHCAETIDFAALAGKRVAVIGAGASAFDNAATALEAGAAEVHLLCRRTEIQVVQPYRWLTFRGFLRHLGDLDDAWRWRFMSAVMGLREGFPQATYDRCAIHEAFRLHLGSPAVGVVDGPAGVELATSSGPITVDFVIGATGIEIDLAARPELSRFAHNIASWGDRYTPPQAERDDRLARFPYLGDDYALCERVLGETPWIADIHLFSIASTMSFGASGSSINAMTTAVPRLVSGLTRGLFRGDVERLWGEFQAYDVPQAVVRYPAAHPSS